MTEKQILSKKQYGDNNLVAQIPSKEGRYVSSANAARLLERPNAARHGEAIEALRLIVEGREKLLQTQTTTV